MSLFPKTGMEIHRYRYRYRYRNRYRNRYRYICMYVCIYIYVDIYIYREREIDIDICDRGESQKKESYDGSYKPSAARNFLRRQLML